MKRKRFSILAMLLAVMFIITPANTVLAEELEGNGAVPSETTATTNITIVHTNDIHGRSAYSDKGKVFGFEKLKGFLDKNPADILLDAGDTLHGQAFATLEQGESIAQLMKAVGYDAMTPGNHDWNYGKDRLKELQGISELPILAANITDQSNSSFFGNSGSITEEIKGIKVGIFGVFDQDIAGDTAPRNIEGLTFGNDADVANRMAQTLRDDGCDIIIALTHQLGLETFVGETNGIDLVVAGHEHALVDEEYQDQEGEIVRVVEAGKYFENIGVVNLTVDSKTKDIIAIKENVHTLQDAATIISNTHVVNVLNDISNRQQQKLNEKVGAASVALDGRWEELRIMETTLGRVVTASYLQETGADVAFENAGGIRLGRNLPAGDIMYKDIIDMAPFGNYIVTKKISGAELRGIVEQSIEIGVQNKKAYDEWKQTGSDKVPWPDNSGSYLQFGGISVTYDLSKPEGQRIQRMLVKEEPLDDGRTYTIATNNFVSLGKDYQALQSKPEINQYSACDEALIGFVKKGQEVVDGVASHANLSVYTPEVPEVPETPETPETPGTPESPSPTEDPNVEVIPTSIKKAPKTSDEGQPFAVAMLFVLSGGVILLSAKSKRSHDRA